MPASPRVTHGYRSVFRPGLFAGQTVVVTGAGSGIGRCTAHELAALGAHVVLVGRKRGEARSGRRPRSAPTAAQAEPSRRATSATRTRSRPLVAGVVAARGRIHGLVNNAGGQFPSPLEDISAKGWQAVLAPTSPAGSSWRASATRSACAKHGGAIVNMLADMWHGMPGMGHSGAARAGMLNFTETAACEWAPVRVNAVAPGWIASSGMDTYPDAMKPLIRSLPRHVPAATPRHRGRSLRGDRVPALGGRGVHLRRLPAHRRRGAERTPALADARRPSTAPPFDGFHRGRPPRVLED